MEQPAGSCLYWMHCFRVLAQMGCVLTTFCFCSYGSPFLKRSTWLHNKSWVAKLQGHCSCQWAGNHFPVRNGSFTTESLSVFLQRCVPNCISVYGFEPLVGDCVATFSGAYPKALALRMASGSLAARAGHWEPLPSSAVELTCRKLNLEAVSTQLPLPAEHEPYPPRDWFEDPEWVHEICSSLQFRELFRYKFRNPGHINVNEARVFKSWVKSMAKTPGSKRAVALLDSRVTIGAAAKGRSSSFAISRVLSGSLGYILGSGLYPGLIHCRSEDNRADDPSRDRPVQAPSREVPLWLEHLLAGDWRRFDQVVESSCLKKIPARWLRFLLLLAGDIERIPGPLACLVLLEGLWT